MAGTTQIVHLSKTKNGGSETPLPPEAIDDFLGSAQVFALALSQVFEDNLLQQIGCEDLTSSQIKILRLVAHKAETVSDLAAFQGVSNAAASKAIDRLVRRGFLARTEGASDRRESELALTPAGRTILDSYRAARREALAKVFGGFAAPELEAATDLMDRMTSSIVVHSPQPEGVCLQCHLYREHKCLVRDAVRGACYYHKRKQRKSGGRAGTET